MDEQQPEPLGVAPPIPIRDRTIPVVDGLISCIVLPPMQANSCDIKTCIQMIQQSVQFGGSPHEDPNGHISSFLEICNTFNYHRGAEEAVRLRAFPYSLKDRAKGWLYSLPAGSITTWTDLATKFLAKYFPPARTAKLRNDITSFTQYDSEPLCEAWERFKDLLRRCPHHEIAKWLQVQTFYNGLNGMQQITVDAAAGGALMAKGEDEAWALLEEMANNNSLWPTDRRQAKRVAGIFELEQNTAVNAHLEKIYKCLEVLSMQAVQNAGNTSAVNRGQYCEDQMTQQGEVVNYVNQHGRQGHNPYSNQYNPGWKDHPNFAWKNSQGTGSVDRQNHYPGLQQQNVETNHGGNPAIEELILQLATQNKENAKTTARLETLILNQAASMKVLETQVGQLASEQNRRAQEFYPSSAECHPRREGQEHCNVISVSTTDALSEIISEICKPISPVYKERLEHNEPPPAFPTRLMSQKELEEATEQQDHSRVPQSETCRTIKEERLTEVCSAILQRTTATKCKDPGIFSIACTIKECESKALCDLGSGINLMPLPMARRLGYHKLTPTAMTLQFADRTVKLPKGKIEDVMVKIGEFEIPTDFIIMEIDEDAEIPFILGRPFLATAGTVIDVHKGSLTFNINGKQLVIQVFEPPTDLDSQASQTPLDTVEGKRKALQMEGVRDEAVVCETRRASTWDDQFSIAELCHQFDNLSAFGIYQPKPPDPPQAQPQLRELKTHLAKPEQLKKISCTGVNGTKQVWVQVADHRQQSSTEESLYVVPHKRKELQMCKTVTLHPSPILKPP